MKNIPTFEEFIFESLNEIKTKNALVDLFRNDPILDDAEYKNLLIHYIESQHNLENDEFEKLVKWMLDNKNNYPKLLKPKSGYAYRGTSITPEMYQNIKNAPAIKEGGFTIIQSPYESTNIAQSWTYDFKTAIRFSDRGLFNNPRLDKGARPAIIRCKIDDTFVGNPSLTKPISNKLGLKDEKEIFHYGKNIKDSEWMIYSADISLGKFDI